MVRALPSPAPVLRSVARVAAVLVLSALSGCGRSPVSPGLADVPIERFAKVDSGLYRGGQPDEEGFLALKGLGVRTVLNLRGEDEDSSRVPSGMDVVQLQAHITKPRAAEIRAFFDIVLDPLRRPVFIHCAEGRERSGFYAALYRIEVDGWPAEKALDEMRALGFRDADHPEVPEFIRAYQRQGFVTRAASAVPTTDQPVR